MPTATERRAPRGTPPPAAHRAAALPLRRRELLALLLGGVATAGSHARVEGTDAAPSATTVPPTRLAAAWDDGAAQRIGWLRAADAGLQVDASLAVPTRAHGLLVEADGALVAVARRPGDWLLRWRAGQAAAQQHWIEPDRAFNGHVLASADGRLLYTTETDLDSGAGLVGVRDARSFERLATWASSGLDPHELLWDADGTLLVANGGIPTQPETGRTKRDLQRMDPSLVRIDPARGRLLGQWRLPDPRLSVRHLARSGERLAIALQAEHEDETTRRDAPVLALFDGRTLRTADPAPRPLAGYGGAVAASGGLVLVGCPRADGAACWRDDGGWLGFLPLDEACAMAATAQGIWAGGRSQGRWLPAQQTRRAAAPAGPPLAALRLDNHWVATAA